MRTFLLVFVAAVTAVAAVGCQGASTRTDSDASAPFSELALFVTPVAEVSSKAFTAIPVHSRPSPFFKPERRPILMPELVLLVEKSHAPLALHVAERDKLSTLYFSERRSLDEDGASDSGIGRFLEKIAAHPSFRARIRSLTLMGRLREGDLRPLARLPGLIELNLRLTEGLTSRELRYVCRSASIRWVSLPANIIRDDNASLERMLAALTPLRELEVLALATTSLDEGPLRELASFPRLHTLKLTTLSDEVLSTLMRCPALKDLRLGSTRVLSERGFQRLTTLPHLRHLRFHGSVGASDETLLELLDSDVEVTVRLSRASSRPSLALGVGELPDEVVLRGPALDPPGAGRNEHGRAELLPHVTVVEPQVGRALVEDGQLVLAPAPRGSGQLVWTDRVVLRHRYGSEDPWRPLQRDGHRLRATLADAKGRPLELAAMVQWKSVDQLADGSRLARLLENSTFRNHLKELTVHYDEQFPHFLSYYPSFCAMHRISLARKLRRIEFDVILTEQCANILERLPHLNELVVRSYNADNVRHLLPNTRIITWH